MRRLACSPVLAMLAVNAIGVPAAVPASSLTSAVASESVNAVADSSPYTASLKVSRMSPPLAFVWVAFAGLKLTVGCAVSVRLVTSSSEKFSTALPCASCSGLALAPVGFA